MSGIEFVGLSFAVIDQLVKIGDKTIAIISDAKDFEADSSKLYTRTRIELNRTKQLKNLLFTSISGREDSNDTPFGRFDINTQAEIMGMFEQLEGTLSQAHRLLWGRYGDAVPDSSPTPSTSSSSTHPSTTRHVSASDGSSPSPSHQLSVPSLKRSSSTSILAKAKWALRDKKQAAQLLNDFNDLNVRILDQTKLLLFASTLGRELEYCTLLQENSSARALGFDADARLRIMAVDEESAMGIENLELPPSTVNFPSPGLPGSNTGVSICQIDSQNLAFEFKSLTAGAGNQKVVRQRTRQLAALLNQEKNPSFRVLQCRGYTYLASRNQFAFLYNLPDGSEPKPVSLLDELRNRNSKPSLGDRFRLALVLASSISQLHMVQWVHKSFRSQKIIFFPNKQDAIEYDKPWVFGFEYSRPAIDFTMGQVEDIENDIYRHPDRQGQPSQSFTKIHDIYALGVVLLEIGLWQPAVELERGGFATVTDPRGIQKQLQKHASKRLRDKVGEKYTNIVLKCLAGDFNVPNDTKDDLKLQMLFRESVISVLEKAAQSV
ncbi:hypothetical protein FN846DRAFT_960926 [Sphaerosporella brunnea]|uniref:Uncharacterized protein n=1 Tax=Sphaerosporella brunnea TaxID=1250544 RepID=A0A5J5EQ51_9PEZI|nr:hypothetical protein FN846DRAFT_960926 [Sphaerosporella brunnea]